MENQTTMTKPATKRSQNNQVLRLALRERYTSVFKSVDTRPVMTDETCKMLAQDLVSDGVAKDAHIGVVDSTPILLLHLREAGFTNAHWLNNNSDASTEQDKQWLGLVKQLTEKMGVVTTQFDSLMVENGRFDVIIGNPPYGHKALLAVKFLNLAFDMCDDVRFVLPLSITRPDLLNKVRMDAEPVRSERLPASTFEGNIKACYQVWAPGKRAKVTKKTSHPDWSYLPKEQRFEADFIIRPSGTYAGKIYFPGEKDYEKVIDSNYHYIKAANEEVVDFFRQNREALIEVSDSCNGRAHCTKTVLVDFYETHRN